jgi:hypothetical protein
MLYDTISTDHRRRPVDRVRRPIDASEVRMNPWLLWRPEAPEQPEVLTVAEMAECICPSLCNRDHVNE